MLKTFSIGGIHPAENKLSAGQPIKEMALPSNVTVPISQHLGAPSKVLVNRGDMVKTGQLISKGDGFVSANIHSPVSGKVAKIEKSLDSSGFRREAVLIEVEGDEWEEGIDRSADLKKDFDLAAEDIIKKIADAGIVGLGGATFPSHVKLSVPRGKKAECIVINGVECEPYLTSDHSLMMEKAEEIIVGIQILMKALGVSKTYVGIENNKPDAIKKLKSVVGSDSSIVIEPLKTQYPQGGEKQLIDAIIKRQVPSGGLPVDVGVVAFNVGTVFAVYEAIQKNKPLFERVVTVTGKAVSKPSNLKVRIGTPVSSLIEEAGGLPENCGKVINGGPMMGKSLSDTNVPVVKGTSGILLIKKEETKRKPVENCIRCSKCVSVCPMGLEPYLLMALGEREIYDRLESEKITDCIECGSCSYTCPSSRPLLDYIRLGKSSVIKIIRSRKQ